MDEEEMVVTAGVGARWEDDEELVATAGGLLMSWNQESSSPSPT